MAKPKVKRARLTLPQRVEASFAREVRLRWWLSILERRAVAAREERRDLPDALVEKLAFVRKQLAKAVRNTWLLREQAGKVTPR